MKVITVINEGLADFEHRWGLRPNAMVMHPQTFYALNAEDPRTPETFLEYDQVKILRSQDMPVGKIRFVL
jgi:hypothetical protein